MFTFQTGYKHKAVHNQPQIPQCDWIVRYTGPYNTWLDRQTAFKHLQRDEQTNRGNTEKVNCVWWRCWCIVDREHELCKGHWLTVKESVCRNTAMLFEVRKWLLKYRFWYLFSISINAKPKLNHYFYKITNWNTTCLCIDTLVIHIVSKTMKAACSCN